MNVAELARARARHDFDQAQIHDFEQHGLEWVPCRFCERPTSTVGTGLCNGCWEVESRLAQFLEAATAREWVRALLEASSP